VERSRSGVPERVEEVYTARSQHVIRLLVYIVRLVVLGSGVTGRLYERVHVLTDCPRGTRTAGRRALALGRRPGRTLRTSLVYAGEIPLSLQPFVPKLW
jgi:hypothetical protein